jgi:4-amino-4-deoxy-L-arabinose transferase-like glycosyltransferase
MEPQNPRSRAVMRTYWIAIAAIGIAVRIALVWRPTDYRLLNSWRECDYTSIARAYYTQGMNILYPRVDWRDDTPGYVEMEFPIIPWISALIYRIAGYREEVLRVVTALCSIAALLAFGRLARRVLPPQGALVATGLFAVNGLLVALSGAAQPEPLQLLLMILTADALHRWVESGSRSQLVLAGGWLGMAILAKSPAACLVVLAGFCLLQTSRTHGLRTTAVYGAATAALVPPALWYVWAHGLYLATGLSLGLSNETHLLSSYLLFHPWTWVIGNVAAEAVEVFAISGILLAVIALRQAWQRIAFAVVWYLSVLLFYVLAADTSGDGWAYYYHAMSVPPACLLMGWGYNTMAERNGAVGKQVRYQSAMRMLGRGLVAVTVLFALVGGIRRGYHVYTDSGLEPMYRCALELREDVPPDGKIVVRGGKRLDEHGHPVAYNASMAFTWMDRRGFNYAEEDFTEKTLRSIAIRGGRYWLAGPDDRRDADVYATISGKCVLIREYSEYCLFDVSPLVQIR